ncbi:hypothetical protein IHE44_0012646 [Lamprotornis superbus]|uniref:Transmembrane protein 110 n=1 Tax=Lamprotornis superbus TaxID=245042 RepID=A0A835NTS3_9PASS|nr:hypothetical protein IHE44_0012646 [Lamprotornis superbus]
MLKRFKEPKAERRPWRIWFYDTSKQAIGALFIHFANVFLSDLTEEDPCSLYLINFILDATLGMLLIWLGVKVISWIVQHKKYTYLVFGEYGDPPQAAAWIGQCILYLLIMVFEKTVISLVLLIPGWTKLQQILLGYIPSPQLELVLVMFVVPFIVNAIMFWVVDSLIMRKYKQKDTLDINGSTETPRARRTEESQVLLSPDMDFDQSESDQDVSGLRGTSQKMKQPSYQAAHGVSKETVLGTCSAATFVRVVFGKPAVDFLLAIVDPPLLPHDRNEPPLHLQVVDEDDKADGVPDRHGDVGVGRDGHLEAPASHNSTPATGQDKPFPIIQDDPLGGDLQPRVEQFLDGEVTPRPLDVIIVTSAILQAGDTSDVISAQQVNSHICFEEDVLLGVAGSHLHVEFIRGAVDEFACYDNFGAVEVVGEEVLGDLLHIILRDFPPQNTFPESSKNRKSRTNPLRWLAASSSSWKSLVMPQFSSAILSSSLWSTSLPMPMVKRQNLSRMASLVLLRILDDCVSPTVGLPSVRKMIRDTLLASMFTNKNIKANAGGRDYFKEKGRTHQVHIMMCTKQNFTKDSQIPCEKPNLTRKELRHKIQEWRNQGKLLRSSGQQAFCSMLTQACDGRELEYRVLDNEGLFLPNRNGKPDKTFLVTVALNALKAVNHLTLRCLQSNPSPQTQQILQKKHGETNSGPVFATSEPSSQNRHKELTCFSFVPTMEALLSSTNTTFFGKGGRSRGWMQDFLRDKKRTYPQVRLACWWPKPSGHAAHGQSTHPGARGQHSPAQAAAAVGSEPLFTMVQDTVVKAYREMIVDLTWNSDIRGLVSYGNQKEILSENNRDLQISKQTQCKFIRLMFTALLRV